MSERKGKKILLVEDEDIIALSEKLDLESYGYDVLTACSGEEAIKAYGRGEAIDLILMDIDLGKGIDGVETAKVILKDRELPIVFLSSHTESEIVEKTERTTSYGYVVKTSSMTVLDASIKMAFKLFEANQATKRTMSKLEATLDALPDQLFETGLDGQIFDCHATDQGLLVESPSRMLG
jgi:CheY-like chemotaxis protein